MLLAGRTQSKFRRFAGVSSAKNAADGQLTCPRIRRNTGRQGMAVCKEIAHLVAHHAKGAPYRFLAASDAVEIAH
jgi:hypothetical protein